MSFRTFIFGCCMLAEVTSWTIDLPEVRKYLFQRNENDKIRTDVNEARERAYYSNIEGNSVHHTTDYKAYHTDRYAKDYSYQSHMENKVQSIVHNGSVYLEGLRRAIENYTQFLDNCTRTNFTVPQTNTTTNTTWRPLIEPSPSFNRTQIAKNITIISRISPPCRAATRASEHVRRLAALAAWATRQLQDIAFARNYQKDQEDGREENELILKLAWFLDKLAHLTGYEPEASQFVSDEPLSSITAAVPTPLSLMNAPEQVKNDMMDCLNSNSSEPATVRCAYPLPLPPMVQQIFNFTDNSTTPPQSGVSPTSNGTERVLPIIRDEPMPEQSLELLITADDRTPLADFPPNLTGVKAKTVRKRYTSHGLYRKLVQKRSTPDENPAMKLVNYFVKHKIWVNSNPIKYNLHEIDANKNNFQEFDVKNHLIVPLSVQKRSLNRKEFQHLRMPENPTEDLSKYLKHKPGINYLENHVQAAKIKSTLEKMHNSKHLTAKSNVQKLEKMLKHIKNIKKRSIDYERMKLPRVSEDPMQDINYYVKNKEGTNYIYDAAQAARVRLALDQVFLTGNIEVVRRFGSNYNPLVPAPFYEGLAKSMADV